MNTKKPILPAGFLNLVLRNDSKIQKRKLEEKAIKKIEIFLEINPKKVSTEKFNQTMQQAKFAYEILLFLNQKDVIA